MSTAFYPMGMLSYNNRGKGVGYATPKGTGIYSNPVAITAGNIPPLTNRDYRNVVAYKHGLARPLKWAYRKGTTSRARITVVSPDDPNVYVTLAPREVRSSRSSSLIGQTMDMPGAYTVKRNEVLEVDETNQMAKDCIDCRGIGLVTDYYPEYFLTNNPLPVCETPQFCCNEQKKALLRVRPANTNLPKNYYTTLQQYRQGRCLTYDQKVFNFYTGSLGQQVGIGAKPGSPQSIDNMYIANCYPNTNFGQDFVVSQAYISLKAQNMFTEADIALFEATRPSTFAEFYAYLQDLESGKVQEATALWVSIVTRYGNPNDQKVCRRVAYKPNNFQFATEGAVTSSTRTFKLTVTTIEKDVYDQNKRKGYGTGPAPLIYKTKVAQCNAAQYTTNGNPKTCFRNSNDYDYLGVSSNGNITPSVANNGISATFSGQPIH